MVLGKVGDLIRIPELAGVGKETAQICSALCVYYYCKLPHLQIHCLTNQPSCLSLLTFCPNILLKGPL